MLYNAWAFVRQSLVKIHLAGANCIHKISGGKLPVSLFSKRSGVHKIGTDVRVIERNGYISNIAKFNPDGTISDDDFVILSSTDFHYDTNHANNQKTTEMFFKHIKDVKPDLVILTGDVILSKYQQIDAIQFAKMMEEIGIYWAIVFGNHETREEKGFYKYLIMKSCSDYEHCLAVHGPKELFGYGNYVINIMGSNGKIKKSLFFFDSGRDALAEHNVEHGLPADFGGYDFLKNSQIDFYKNNVDELEKKYGKFGSMMYFHIPLVEYSLAFEGSGNMEYKPTGNVDILYGKQFESAGSSKHNSGMFEAGLEKGLNAVFCGHDHNNDWCGIYKGVYLAYNLPQNYNLYHLGTHMGFPEEKWNQGVTVTKIHADGSFDIAPRYNSMYL